MTDNAPKPYPIPPAVGAIFAKIGRPIPLGDLGPEPAKHVTAEEIAAANRERALDRHARHTPARYRDSVADRPEVLDWVARYLIDGGSFGSLMLQGFVGTGKTHQAYGALRAIAESGAPDVDWRATTACELYRRLRPNDANDQDRVLSDICSAPLLLLDDLGAANPSKFVEEVTYQVVDHRYANCLPTIFTTNLATGPLYTAIGQRSGSRLTEMCTWVSFDGPDRRYQ